MGRTTNRAARAAALMTLITLGACDGNPAGPTRLFDRELADSLVRRQMSFGPRVPGTEAHAEALAWMVGFLRDRADTVETMPFTYVDLEGNELSLTNVWAQFRPALASRILLVAHWDSRPVAERAADPTQRQQPVPGANDGASGVAVLLTIADHLSREAPGVGVDILLTDGEDWGHDPITLRTRIQDMLLGARHFAEVRGADYRPLYGIVLDLVGDNDPRFPQEGFSLQFAPEVVRRVWDKAAELGHGDVFLPIAGQAISDDHVPLNEVGIRTIDIIDFDYPHWHTPEDTADKISARSLEIVGEVVLSLLLDEGGGS